MGYRLFRSALQRRDYLKTLQLLGNNALVIAEHHHKTELPERLAGCSGLES